MVTPALFEAFPTVQDMAAVSPEEIFPYIKSVSYPNSKSEHLAQMARMVCERFGGKIPQDMDSMTQLPGVGRKTANVMLAVAFGGQAMPVDTHVFRVSHRLGLVAEKDDTPYKVERALTKNIPEEDIPRAHHWLLLHGRYVCTSRKPHCERCGLNDVCPTAYHH
jgi:endonuclease-3